MKAERFLDTNIVVYATSKDPSDASKKETSLTLMREPGIGLSAQVVQEFFHVATRKDRLGISFEAAEKVVACLHMFPILPITYTLVHQAIKTSKLYQIGYFDAAIIDAARQLGCSVVYSEDLNHGQDYGGIKVVNPFA